MLKYTLIFMILNVLPLHADTISPAEFERRVEGKTLSFAKDGLPVGVEQYLRGRRVIWAFVDGQCEMGRYFVQDDNICFEYDKFGVSYCWVFFEQEGQMHGHLVGETPEDSLVVVGESDAPINCVPDGLGV